MDFDKIELSILWKNKEEVFNRLNKWDIKNIHLDIMDGYFVSNLSNITPFSLNKLWIDNKYNLHLHLMVKNPEIYFSYFSFLKNTKKLSFHIEIEYFKNNTYKVFVNWLQQKWIKVWLTLNPDTKINLLSNKLGEFDFIQLMTVYPWKWWQKFIEKMFSKIEKLRKIYDWEIIIDGWVNQGIYEKLKNKVNTFVMWSYLFK